MRAYAEACRKELKRRSINLRSLRTKWIAEYGGRPREFIGELIGALWHTPGYAAWRAFVAALFTQKLAADELGAFTQCTGLRDQGETKYREAWLPIGRRGGKSRALALIAVYLAVCEDWTPYLVPGERGHIVVLAAQTKQARVIMNYVKAALGDERLKGLVERDLAETIDLAGQVTIEVVTASISAVRSRTILCALCDEIAFWRSDETSANPDAEILNALRPAMATIPGALLLAASSPYARKGQLWEMYHRYYGKPEGPLVWKAPTWIMNPTVPQSFLDEEYDRDPVAADAEYGAEFRSDVAAFITREAVEAAVHTGRIELAPGMGVQYRAFTDPSGGISDSMTLAIAHKEGDRIILDVLREARPPFNPDTVVTEFTAVLRDYGITEVKGDHYAGEWPREAWRKNGISYIVSEYFKSDIYLNWLPILNAGRAELLDNSRLINQACALERKTSRSGKDSIDHPPMGHDDVVNVAAGAMMLAAGQRYPSLWTPDNLPSVA